MTHGRQQSNTKTQEHNELRVNVSPHKGSPSVSHSPDPLAVCIKKRRPLRDAEDGVIVSSVLVIEVGGVEEVEALQGTLHRQAEAGWPATVAWEPTLRRGRVVGGERLTSHRPFHVAKMISDSVAWCFDGWIRPNSQSVSLGYTPSYVILWFCDKH